MKIMGYKRVTQIHMCALLLHLRKEQQDGKVNLPNGELLSRGVSLENAVEQLMKEWDIKDAEIRKVYTTRHSESNSPIPVIKNRITKYFD